MSLVKRGRSQCTLSWTYDLRCDRCNQEGDADANGELHF